MTARRRALAVRRVGEVAREVIDQIARVVLRAMDEGRLAPPEDGHAPRSFAVTTVPSGHCFLLGDNRHHSVDSREIGPVPLTDIVGRVDP